MGCCGRCGRSIHLALRWASPGRGGSGDLAGVGVLLPGRVLGLLLWRVLLFHSNSPRTERGPTKKPPGSFPPGSRDPYRRAVAPHMTLPLVDQEASPQDSARPSPGVVPIWPCKGLGGSDSSLQVNRVRV